MGGIKGLRVSWHCKFCGKSELKTPWHAKVDIYCNPICQGKDRVGKYCVGLANYWKNHPEGYKEHKRPDPKKISETVKKRWKEGVYKHSGRLGTKWSEEQRKNYLNSIKKVDMSWWKIGKPTSIKQKQAASEVNKGKPTWNKGKELPIEMRRKISEANRGEKGSNWKGGITSINGIIRSGIESRLWRESVFMRDDWTCQKTGIKGGRLRAHHLQNFSQYPELRFEISNGITLSKEAHKEFHKRYGNKDNTREQLEEFLKT
jgi:hypothetical protein